MTYREKWELDHPGQEFKVFGLKEGEWNCPYKNGYEDAPNVDTHCMQPCMDCWNREMPGTEEKPHILDSGERRQFETGAVRDIQEGKGRCDLMPLEVLCKYFKKPIFGLLGMFLKDSNTAHLYECIRLFSSYYGEETNTATDCTMLLEVAKHFEEGAKKYGENNWQKGLPVHCYIDSAVRHYLKWLRGDKDEPHDRAFVWNLLCCIWECDFSPRAKTKEVSVAEEAPVSEDNSGRLYICNRKPCETCYSDCHCTTFLSDAAVLELSDREVRYEDCPIGLFVVDSDGVFLKTEIVNAETGLNTAVHIGLGLSRKFEADTMVTPIKYPFEERERV